MQIREDSEQVPGGFTEKRKDSILHGKSVQLARRVQPWLYEKIKDNKDVLLRSLTNIINSENPLEQLEAIEDTKNLFAKVDKQMFKTLVVHAIALVAIGIITTGVILSFLSFPFLIPLAIGIIGSCVAMTASTLKACTLPVEDWSFCPSYLLPTFLRPHPYSQRIKAE